LTVAQGDEDLSILRGDREVKQKVLFLFVGERPSNRAVSMQVTWTDWRLAGATLREALVACTLTPEEHSFTNLWESPERGHESDWLAETRALWRIRRAARRGFTVVGLGQLVQARLEEAGIEHLRMRHPAARGLLRMKVLYWWHVFEVLMLREERHWWRPAARQRKTAKQQEVA
jgi:hypothetical protein